MKIVVLGNSSIYTKMICKHLDDNNIEYSIVLEKNQNTRKGIFFRLLEMPVKIERLLSSGKYKALPNFHIFTLKLLIQDFLYNKSKKKKTITNPYINYSIKAKSIFYTPNVNHIKTAKIIEELNADIGVFAGVGIVDGLIIEKFNKFCLNAHPAPLPKCRGGGALENTLYYNLKPSVSVHYGTAEIDEGKIIKIKELEIDKDDTFNSISTKLPILCAELLAEVVVSINNDEKFDLSENNGKLHYWKDCNVSVQKNARKNLAKLLRKLD